MPHYGLEGIFELDDEEDDFNLTRRMRNPYMMNLYGGSDFDPGVDPNDPATAAYISRAKEPPPSQNIYREYLAGRPEEEQFKSNIWQKIGGALLGLGGQAKAARSLVHPGYERAFADWQTEGKYVPQLARSADIGRQRELEAERFGIVGQAKRRQFEETKRKTSEIERTRAEAAKARALKEASTKERAESRESRAEAAAVRAETREARAEEREERGIEKEVKGEKRASYKEKKKDLEKELGKLEDQVSIEIENNPKYKELFVVNRNGEKIPAPGNEEFLQRVRESMVAERRKKLESRFYSEAAGAGLIHKLGEE